MTRFPKLQQIEPQRPHPAFEGRDFAGAEHRQVVIVGTGPAGFTAAIYAARANLEPLVLRGAEPGGQLTSTTEVENYPGFPDGVTGPDLMEMFERQAVRFGSELRWGVVTAVDFSERPYRLLIDDEKPLLADTVILATGASARFLGLKNEQRLRNRGVSACATCDGAFFRDRRVAVIGGGDSALEEALFLTRFATEVFVIHRRGELRASKILQQRARNNEKIRFVWHSQVRDVLGEDQVEGVLLENTMTGEVSELAVTGLFLAIGHTPNTGLLGGVLATDDNGYLVTEPGSSRTSLPGVFACGDVQDPDYRQAITAAGSGATAALDAEHWLAEQESAGPAEQESAGPAAEEPVLALAS